MSDAERAQAAVDALQRAQDVLSDLRPGLTDRERINRVARELHGGLHASHSAEPTEDTLAEAADRYLNAVRLAGSYPGHEEHIEAEYVEILAEQDDAELALEDALLASSRGVSAETKGTDDE